MKTCLACLFAASLLLTAPAAGAEELQSVHTISVVGVGYAPIPPMANRTEADVDYNQAMINAVANGLSKAQALAEAAGARVGSIEAISESGKRKETQCKNAAGESAPYKGIEPDAGTAEPPTIAVEPALPFTVVSPLAVAKAPTPAKHKRKKHRRIERKTHRAIARTAESVATSCEVSSELTLIYGLVT